ncbi:MAG: hypothetical protein HWE14_03010 [Flavobacteriia bacterium]|nr:hypothetical protein [Flavobacteriia bacterium]
MPRMHLFEWEDQLWFPAFLRNYMTDFLEFVSHASKLYKSVPEVLLKTMKDAETLEILDLGSGGGGPWRQVLPALVAAEPHAKVVLSDYYPNIAAFKKLKTRFPENIEYIETSVDARNVEEHTHSIRTQFLSLHHFKPEDATAILRNAVQANTPIVIVEGQSRNLPSLIGMLFSPITTLLVTPFIKPTKPARLLFTYLIPILPILIMWDGIVSVLRTYSKTELKELATKADTQEQFSWEFIKSAKSPATMFVGMPKSKQAED